MLSMGGGAVIAMLLYGLMTYRLRMTFCTFTDIACGESFPPPAGRTYSSSSAAAVDFMFARKYTSANRIEYTATIDSDCRTRLLRAIAVTRPAIATASAGAQKGLQA